MYKSNPQQVFLGKAVLKICTYQLTGEHPCLSVLSVKLFYGCSPINLLHIFRARFYQNTNEGLLLNITHFTIHNKYNIYIK